MALFASNYFSSNTVPVEATSAAHSLRASMTDHETDEDHFQICVSKDINLFEDFEDARTAKTKQSDLSV